MGDQSFHYVIEECQVSINPSDNVWRTIKICHRFNGGDIERVRVLPTGNSLSEQMKLLQQAWGYDNTDWQGAGGRKLPVGVVSVEPLEGEGETKSGKKYWLSQVPQEAMEFIADARHLAHMQHGLSRTGA